MATFERVSDQVRRGAGLTILVDGTPVPAFDGESVATALLAADRLDFRRTPRGGEPRGAFCAMGVCFECLVTIDGVSQVRGCMVTVKDGMFVATQPGSGDAVGSDAVGGDAGGGDAAAHDVRAPAGEMRDPDSL